MVYFEDLHVEGQSCPPPDVSVPNGEKEYFRALNGNPPTPECFISHRLKFPTKSFSDECEARSLSLSDTIDGLINGYYKIPAIRRRHKVAIIGSIFLKDTDGHVKQTGAKSHHSWWRSQAFDTATVTIQEIQL